MHPSTDGAAPYGNLLEDDNGNFCGTTLEGGPAFQGTVFKITPAGTEVPLYAFSGPVAGVTDGMGPNGNLIFGANGDLYGLTTRGGVNDVGTVFSLIP